VSAQLTSFIAAHGILAVFVLMAIDAVLPAASELVMLYSGALAAGAFGRQLAFFGAQIPTGTESFVVLVLAGTLGYLVGSLAGWAIGARGGRALIERRGRWLHLSPERLDRAERWFERFGSWAVFLGRITPLVRSFISIPAGVLGSPLPRYTILTLAGSLLWCLTFAGIGAALGSNYEQFHRAFGHVDEVVAGLVVIGAIVLVARRLCRPPAATAADARR
jgi:membrane protein DedA with SNARE-associated domain